MLQLQLCRAATPMLIGEVLSKNIADIESKSAIEEFDDAHESHPGTLSQGKVASVG